MDNLENTPPQPDVAELQEQCDSLRHLVVSLLVLMLVVSGTLTIFLVRQWRFTRNDLVALRSQLNPQINQVIADYTRNKAPAINDFLHKLGDYSKTHPDFAPIAAKYGIKPNSPTSAIPPVGTPPPAPKAKK
jgi:hypothetical protein